MERFVNVGNTEVFYDWKMDPVEVPKNFVFALKHQSGANILPVKTIVPLATSANQVVFKRTYAFGDLLMLLPVIREFQATYPGRRYFLLTSGDFLMNSIVVELSKTLGLELVSDTYSPPADVGFIMNGLVEEDRRIERLKKTHRVDIFREFLDLPVGKAPKWDLLPNWVGTHGVVFCSGGSDPIRQLPVETADYIAAALQKRFRSVVHIRDERKMPLPELLSALQNARCLITTDTAPLWLGHYTRTPTVFVSGPTTGVQRISYHPLFPDGVQEVALRDLVPCKACNEIATSCSSKISCLKYAKETVLRLVEEAMEKVMWKS